MTEEIVESEEIIDDVTDPESVDIVIDDVVVNDEFTSDDNEVSVLKSNNQLSGEEEIIGTGSGIIKKKRIKKMSDEYMIKNLLPNASKRLGLV